MVEHVFHVMLHAWHANRVAWKESQHTRLVPGLVYTSPRLSGLVYNPPYTAQQSSSIPFQALLQRPEPSLHTACAIILVNVTAPQAPPRGFFKKELQCSTCERFTNVVPASLDGKCTFCHSYFQQVIQLLAITPALARYCRFG